MERAMRFIAMILCAGIASAQIVTIQGTDTISSSRTTINNNFSWLNTNKAATNHNHDAAYVSLSGAYVNPSWITSLAWSKLTGVPTFENPLAFSAPLSRSTNTISLTTCSEGQLYKIVSGVWTCAADQTGEAGGGITSLNGLTDSSQTFSKTDDTNVTLTITSATGNHQFALGWTGALAKSRQHANTLYSDGSYSDPSWLTLTWGGGRIAGIPSAFTPSAHASTHVAAGSDPLTLAISQITNLQNSLDAKQSSLGFTPENAANKGAASGYASLDGSTKVPIAQIPTGTSGSTVALGNHTHSGVYEPVDATILRQANLAGSGSATTPARSDHNHSGTYEPVDATIARTSGTKTQNAVIVFDAAGKLIASGCTIVSGVLNCNDGTVSSALILPELAANGSNDFRIYGADNQTSSGCIVLSGQPTSGQTMVDSGSTATMTDGSVCRVMSWSSPSGGAPTDAHYLTTQAETGLSAESNLGALSTGILKITVSGGVATPGVASAGDFPTLNQSTTGNAATATALAANPSDCSAGQYATTIAANGNLTCAQVAYSQISSTPTIPTITGSAVLKGSLGDAVAAGYADVVNLWTSCASGYLKYNGTCDAGSAFSPAYTSVTFSATPTFTVSSHLQGFTINLTGNITSSTLSGATAGDLLMFKLCQDATGGRTVVYPTGFSLAPTVLPLASACTSFSGTWDGSALVNVVSTSDSSISMAPTTSAPGSNPPSGNVYPWFDSTANTQQTRDSSGNIASMVRTAGSGTTNQWVDYIGANGVPHTSQPAFSNISGSVAASQLPNPGASTLGGVKALTCSGTDKLSAIGTDGLPVCSADQTAAGGSGLADPGSNGVVVRTSLDNTTARTITGTSNHIAITNGDGVSGNPTIDLDTPAKTWSKSLTLLDPVTTDTGRVQFVLPYAGTITWVGCSVAGGTSMTINLDKRAFSTPGTTGTSVLSAGLVCDTNGQTSCASGCDANTISSSSVSSRAPVALTISAASGTNTELRVYVEGTY